LKVVQLLLNHGANPLLLCTNGESAFWFCCQEGYVDICKLLYKYGARVKFLYDSNGEVLKLYLISTLKGPLHIACEKGHPDIIEFLLNNGADINNKGNDGMTPLHNAIHEKHFSTCKLILKYDQVSIQNIEFGIIMSADSPQIHAMLEKNLKNRKRVKRRAQTVCSFCKEVPLKRFVCGKCEIAIYCSLV
jgi:ankyrin repeat protein